MTALNLSVTPNAQPQIDALTAAVPTMETERLILRIPRLSDWSVLESIFTTDQGKFIGGPFSPQDAWLDFNQLIASWLLRGYGALTIQRKSDDAILGLVLLTQEFGDPETELGWLLTAEAEGHGYATEAARALHETGVRLFGANGFVSYIDAANTRSINLATRLGATCDAAPHPASDSCLVFRHTESTQ